MWDPGGAQILHSALESTAWHCPCHCLGGLLRDTWRVYWTPMVSSPSDRGDSGEQVFHTPRPQSPSHGKPLVWVEHSPAPATELCLEGGKSQTTELEQELESPQRNSPPRDP